MSDFEYADFTEEENPAEMENDMWRNVEFESSVLNIRKL